MSSPEVARSALVPRVIATLPLAVAAVLYGLVTQSYLLTVIALVAALTALLVAPRIDAPPFVQRATLLVVVLFGALGGAAAITSIELAVRTRPSELLGRIAVTAVLLATARRFFREPEGGAKPDFALLTVAVVVCGQRRVGPAYTLAATLFVFAVVLVVRSRDVGAGWSVVEAHALRATTTILAIVGLLSTVTTLALPRLVRLTEAQFERFVLPSTNTQLDFSGALTTATPFSLTESDALVFRVYGPHVDYLRGHVWDQFDGNVWENSGRLVPLPVDTTIGTAPGANVTEVRAVGTLARASDTARFFVPLGARHLGTAHGLARVDPDLGTLRPAPEEPATPISFEVGAAEHPPAAPTEVDRRVPEKLRAVLEPIARGWTAGATTDEAKLAALEHHLETEFTYTLDGIVPTMRYAVVQFLTESRRGRCQIFATALAVLARAVGIPTRVVGGFRVAEHNDLGGYDVVREKNAHAWVEAWVSVHGAPPAWTTYDATPAIEANLPHDRHGVAALGDAVLAHWDRGLELLGRADLWQFGVLLAGAVALLTAVRLLRARRERLRALRGDDHGDGPLPSYARLETALASRGHARPPSEPLEAYASRLREAHQEDAARVVLAYGALRYGGIGDADAVAAGALACARELEAARADEDADRSARR